MTAVRTSGYMFPTCTGCGEKLTGPYASFREVFKTGFSELKFCDTCMNHIKRGGPIFFTTYSYGYPTNNNY